MNVFKKFCYLFIFLVILFFNYSVKVNFRWILLLAASIVFYIFMAETWIFVLVFITCVTYAGALLIDSSNNARGKYWLLFFIIIILGAFFYYKYFGFIIDLLNISISGIFVKTSSVSLFLPLGISFFTFRALSYIRTAHSPPSFDHAYLLTGNTSSFSR